MKIMGGVVCFGLTLCLVAPARATAPATARPAAVFGELVSAPPATEQPRIASMLGQFGAKGGIPPVDGLIAGLGKMVGANALEGIDTKRPVALVMLDPRTFPKPVLLVAEVAADKALATSLAGSPDVASKRQKRLVVIGSKDALDAGADYALSRLKTGPTDGIRVRVFVEPVWAAFGAQAQLVKAAMMAQGGQPGSPIPAATMGRMFDGLIAGIEQSHELDIELGARLGGFDLVMTLLVKPGTAMDKFAAQQSPADFSLVGKFADQPYSMVAGGRVNMAGAGEGLMEMLLGGPNKDPKLSAQMADWIRLASGELAMMGQVLSPSKVEYQYLLRSPEAQKLAAVFPAMIDAMSSGGMFEGMAKIARTPKANASYDGLTLAQSELHYDFSKMTTIPEKDRKFTLQSVWTSWDDLVAMSTGATAGDRMRKLIDSARHGKGSWQPNATIRTSIERARAAKESFWMRMDLSAMSAGAPKPVPMPPGIAPSVGMGAATHTLWMRISVPAPPQTAGSL